MAKEFNTLSPRIQTVLKSAGIHNGENLKEKTKADILKLRNLGKPGITELDKYMRENGFTWKITENS